MNKKANFFAMILIFLAIVVLLLVGFGASLLGATLNNVASEIVPVFNSLGTVGDTNFSQVTQLTLTPVQATLGTLDYLFGVLYFVSLFMILALAVSFRMSGNQWIIPVFIVFSILLLIVSIVVSNAYEEFYSSDDIIGTNLREQTIMSYALIYAPAVSVFLFFICGIIMFTGTREDFV